MLKLAMLVYVVVMVALFADLIIAPTAAEYVQVTSVARHFPGGHTP
jgi:hypothetical protein